MTFRLERLMQATAALSLADLRSLDAWLHEQIRLAEAAAAREIPQTPRRLVVDERRTPAVVYRRELVDCGKERCHKCSKGPAHGPYWYAYWWQGGKTRSKYIGKTLPHAG
jgi:hypothetical protein